MNKIDCSNIFNFMDEWERMSRYHTLVDIKIALANCVDDREVLENFVEKLQELSDQHPKKTRKDKFIEMCKNNGFEDVVCEICKNGMPLAICEGNGCHDCEDYWNEVAD